MNKDPKSWIREGTTAMLFGVDFVDGIAIRFDANTAIADSNISISDGDDLEDGEWPLAIIKISDTTDILLDADDLWFAI